MSFIGIDLGATFIKGAILDAETVQIRHLRRIPFPDFEPGQAFERVISPEKVLTTFYKILNELLALTPTCDGLLLCGQMHALTFCDADGNSQSPIISWQDQRTQIPVNGKSYFDILKSILQNQDLKILGNELRPGLPLTQLFYLSQKKEIPTGVFPASLMDFIAANLCHTAPITDSTNAEAHGIYNLITKNWDFDLIKTLGLNELHWQTIRPHLSVAGTFTKNNREIPCYVAMGDQQCALLGSFLEEHELSLNIATGSQVSLLANQCEFGNYQTRPYFENQYLKTITHLPAGRALNALLRLLTEISTPPTDLDTAWAYIQNQVEQIHETSLQINTAFYNGPLGASGSILNLREDNMNIGHIFYAAFNNMAENYHQCALRLSPKSAWHKIIFSGGLVTKHPTLQKAILRRITGVPFRVNVSKEDVLIGLLILAIKIYNSEPSLKTALQTVRNFAVIQET